MIKKLITLISLVVTHNAYANIEIKLSNVPNNHQVYIKNYVFNTKIKAFRLSGTSAIIADYKLENAPHASYTVIVEGPDHTYSCVTSNLVEFMFTLSPNVKGQFTITMRNKKGQGLIAMCTKYTTHSSPKQI